MDNEIFQEIELTESLEENIDNNLAKIPNDDYEEVINLTEYDSLPTKSNMLTSIAEYNNIDSVTINKKYELQARDFVNRITSFIISFNDVELSQDHEDYLKSVAELQISDLKDMLTLIEINRQLLTNIIERINSTQLEDYAIITNYNMMVNQHLKLMKELQHHYRNIPTVIKKMRADIMTDQIIDKQLPTVRNDVITEDYGSSQFNSHKEMLRAILNNENK